MAIYQKPKKKTPLYFYVASVVFALALALMVLGPDTSFVHSLALLGMCLGIAGILLRIQQAY